jgi:hypothetical protein
VKGHARAALAIAVLVAAVWLVIRLGQSPPDGPVAVAWDDAACAECRMHVGNPAFAAQLQTQDGEVLDFDDPGCLFRYRAAHHPRVHAVYFHAHEGDAWLRETETAFARVSETPMGYGLAAAPRGTPGALSVREAERLVREGGQR